jgi:hypothetical protein
MDIPCVKLTLLGCVGYYVLYGGLRLALFTHSALEELELVLGHRGRTLGDRQQRGPALGKTCCTTYKKETFKPKRRPPTSYKSSLPLLERCYGHTAEHLRHADPESGAMHEIDARATHYS